MVLQKLGLKSEFYFFKYFFFKAAKIARAKPSVKSVAYVAVRFAPRVTFPTIAAPRRGLRVAPVMPTDSNLVDRGRHFEHILRVRSSSVGISPIVLLKCLT